MAKVEQKDAVHTIDFSVELKDIDGTPAKMPNETKALTLGIACASALLQTYPQEQVDGIEKVRRYVLAQKLYNGNPRALTVEDIKRIKDCAARFWGPLMVGQIWAIVDPPSVKLDE